uniref:ShKT domain-containing protein n=1 Tax=Parastrongyloides trichosuri TaxID=131310 RepID=A0A0N5A3D5_PARTI
MNRMLPFMCVILFTSTIIAQSMEPSSASTCVDSDLKCSLWASQGECQSNAMWMMANCRRSCQSCQGGDRAWKLRQLLAQSNSTSSSNATKNVFVESVRLNHVEMDEAKQMVKVFGRMVFSWNDSKVSWDKDQWGISWLNFYWVQIFTPQLIQINGPANNPGTITSKVLAANYTGQVYMWTDFNFAVPYNFVYTEYPNDYQRVCFKFDDKRYFSVRFSVSPELSNKQRAELTEVHISGWTVENLSVTDSKYVISILGDWKRDPFDIETNNCELCIGLRRNAVYYYTEIMLPALVTTLLSICSVLFQLSHTQYGVLAFSILSQILSLILLNSRMPTYTSSTPQIVVYAGFNLCTTAILFIGSLILRKLALSNNRVPPPHHVTMICDVIERILPINNSKESEISGEGEYSKVAHSFNILLFAIATFAYIIAITAVFII